MASCTSGVSSQGSVERGDESCHLEGSQNLWGNGECEMGVRQEVPGEAMAREPTPQSPLCSQVEAGGWWEPRKFPCSSHQEVFLSFIFLASLAKKRKATINSN